MLNKFRIYIKRMAGTEKSLPRKKVSEIWWSWLASFLAIYMISILNVSVGLSQVDSFFLLASLAVSIAIVVMHITRTMHPPGGATALIAVIGSSKIHELGYFFVLFPIFSSTIVMLIVALAINNISNNPNRHYPRYWV